jgi:Ca2+/Na+ antiporter
MTIKPKYSKILSLALVAYGVFYFSTIWDYFYHIHLVATIHPANLQYHFPRSFNEISEYLLIYVPTCFLIAGFGFLLKERWAIFFGLPAAFIGLTAFPLGTLLSCCIFYYLFDIYKNSLHFK